jgi:hypothetical protein
MFGYILSKLLFDRIRNCDRIKIGRLEYFLRLGDGNGFRFVVWFLNESVNKWVGLNH